MSNSESVNTVEDIEVYVHKFPFEPIRDWLGTVFDAVAIISSGKVVHELEVVCKGRAIPVMIVEQAVDKVWTSIWFKTLGTPWQDDTGCAKSLQAFSQCVMRCNGGPWQEGADMDEWWQLDDQGVESLVKWPNASS